MSSLPRDVLANTEALGAICFNSATFALFLPNFLQGKQWAQFIYNIWHNIWTSLSPFDLLKDIFIKGAVSTCFLDLFQAHDLLVEATLFSSSSVHDCSLNNEAATWLHAAPGLK